MIDVRSDTVTQPSEEMREAMRNATVGDDYYHLDPTVKTLEEMSADLLAKEAALLMPSGTMANSSALLSHTSRGESMILEQDAHVYRCETGHIAVVAGVLPKRIPGRKGVLDPDAIAEAVIGEGVLNATTSLIWLENTHNGAGGTCTDLDTMAATRAVAEQYGLRIHIDGERIFNAALALGVSVANLVRDADSIQFGLTKGLAAPFGSVLAGDEEFIKRARKYRQMLGGGMRQAGFMAAAGVVALETMIDRLAEDHRNARILAEGLAEQRMEICMEAVQTNIVFFEVPEDLMDAGKLVEALAAREIHVSPPSRGSRRIRMVTHYGIDEADIREILAAVEEIVVAARQGL